MNDQTEINKDMLIVKNQMMKPWIILLTVMVLSPSAASHARLKDMPAMPFNESMAAFISTTFPGTSQVRAHHLIAQNTSTKKKKKKTESYYPGYEKVKQQKQNGKTWKFNTNRDGGNTLGGGNTKWRDYKLLYQYTRDLGQPSWVHPANRK